MSIETLGQYLKKARESAGLTINQVKGIMGVSGDYLSQLEGNQIKTPSAHFLWTLAKIYSIDLKDLLIIAGVIISKQKL